MSDESKVAPFSASSSGFMSSHSKRIGEVLLDAGLLTPDQVTEVSRYCRDVDARFGEAAVSLGYIDEVMLRRALATQFDLSVSEGEAGEEPVSYTAPTSPAAEDYRSIRNALTLRWFKHPQGAKTLAVVSAQRHEGRSVMAANLAVCFAQVGFRTLLIDADMRNPTLHKLFRLDDHVGLSGLLSGRPAASPFQAIPGIPSLAVLPAGGIPPNPQELLLRQYLPGLVERAKHEFEMIIFDTPAAATGSDYQILGAIAEGALIVTRAEQTRARATRRVVQTCRDFGIRIVGSAMTSQS